MSAQHPIDSIGCKEKVLSEGLSTRFSSPAKPFLSLVQQVEAAAFIFMDYFMSSKAGGQGANIRR